MVRYSVASENQLQIERTITLKKRTLYKGIDRLAIVLTKECNLKLFRKSFCSRHYMGCFINPIEIFWLHLYSITWGYAINVLYNATSVWSMPKGAG